MESSNGSPDGSGAANSTDWMLAQGGGIAADLAAPWRVAVEAAVDVLRNGGTVIVTDDEDRENEGDLVMAAQDATAESIAFMVRHTTGILCAPMTAERLDLLELPLMVADNTEAHATAFTVTVDHVSTSTGVSASDRAATLRALADPASRPVEFNRPGHVFPLRARPGGVLKRAGHTEASVDLLVLAGKRPVAVIGELVADGGEMAREADLRSFAQEHGLVSVTIADLVRYRRWSDSLVTRSAVTTMPTGHGDFTAVAYSSSVDDAEHLALVLGDVAAQGAEPGGVLVRVHSECLTGDVFGSLRCDCGSQLNRSLAAIAEEGSGVLIYLRGHEGRGIGLSHKLRAYSLQDHGADTVDANLRLGLPIDSREYGIGAQILLDLGVSRMRLITNNPEKYSGLSGYDIEILSRVSIPVDVTPQNLGYLRTKRDRMGHLIVVPDDAVVPPATRSIP